MTDWPATLPQTVQQDNFEETTPDVVIRSNVDQGPAKTRRRFTDNVTPFTVRLHMTTAQVAIFDAFYKNDIYSGSTSFTWVHPRTQDAADFRITSKPKYTPAGPDWWVDFSMELML